MSTTKTKTPAFAAINKPAANEQPAQVRTEKAARAEGEIVRLSLRADKKEWKILHAAAQDRNTSINAMLLDDFFEKRERDTGLKRE